MTTTQNETRTFTAGDRVTAPIPRRYGGMSLDYRLTPGLSGTVLQGPDGDGEVFVEWTPEGQAGFAAYVHADCLVTHEDTTATTTEDTTEAVTMDAVRQALEALRAQSGDTTKFVRAVQESATALRSKGWCGVVDETLESAGVDPSRPEKGEATLTVTYNLPGALLRQSPDSIPGMLADKINIAIRELIQKETEEARFSGGDREYWLRHAQVTVYEA